MKQKEYNEDTEIDYVKLIYTFPPLYAKSAAEKQRFLLYMKARTKIREKLFGGAYSLRSVRQKLPAYNNTNNAPQAALSAPFAGRYPVLI